jgi:hypothetical protein
MDVKIQMKELQCNKFSKSVMVIKVNFLRGTLTLMLTGALLFSFAVSSGSALRGMFRWAMRVIASTVRFLPVCMCEIASCTI